MITSRGGSRVLFIDFFDSGFDDLDIEDAINGDIKPDEIIKDIKVVDVDEGKDQDGNRICMRGFLVILEKVNNGL